MELLPDNDIIFALDIGTRTVIGLVASVKENKLVILAEEVREHPGRAMFDGQIHDIPQVASVVSEIKNALEKKVARPLDKVAVAAAGRSLYTVKVSVEHEVDENMEIDSAMVRGLEMDALREAHRRLDEQPEVRNRYYCVGHTALGYSLDGYSLANLIGHRGRVIGCEVIATFLPVSVVNGLYAVLERSGMEPVNLTLEPIAAIDVAIPENFRLLNLALVDMGAGTSDLAISRDGTIVAYGMVPVAGDEITEALVNGCLVDFDTAEGIKKQIREGADISFTDVVGIEHTLNYEEIMEIINPVLDKVAGEIADNLLKLNGGQPPRSVFCVGGGSRIPTFTERLARRLGLPPQRVVLRDRSNLKNVIFNQGESSPVTGPEGVTVVGIASVAVKRMGFDFMSIVINGREYRLFNTRELTVSDALGLVHFNPRDLIGKNGRDLYFYLNGKRQVVFGGLARPAQIQVNGHPATLQTAVKDGDEIFVIKAENGRDAKAKVADYLPGKGELRIVLNGEEEVLHPICLVNGKRVRPQKEIFPGDNVVIKPIGTVADLIEARGLDSCNVSVRVNGSPVGATYPLSDGDRVELLIPENGSKGDGANSECKKSGAKEVPSEEGVPVTGTRVRVNGEEILLTKPEPIFTDIFEHVEIDCSQARGILVLKLNGNRAKYTDPLSEGDEIEIYWEGEKD